MVYSILIIIVAIVVELHLMVDCLSGFKNSWIILEESYFNRLIAMEADSIMIVLQIHFLD